MLEVIRSGLHYRFFLLFSLVGIANSAWAEDLLPPQIVHEPCEFYKKGAAFQVVARFYDDSPLFDPKVIYRNVGATSGWKNAPFNKGAQSEDFVANLPAEKLRGAFEYFIEAFDENGNGPARYGGIDSPLRVKSSNNPPECVQVPVIQQTQVKDGTSDVVNPSPQTADLPVPNSVDLGASLPSDQPAQTACELEDRPVYCSPWLWVGIGTVVLAGAGVGGYFIYQGTNAGPQTRGTINFNITSPAPAGAP